MSTENVTTDSFEFGGSISLDYLKKEIADSQNKGGSLNKWTPSLGTNTIRIFPYKHGSSPFIKTFFHYMDDNKPGMLCSKQTFGESDCPICDFVRKLYATELEEDKAKGSQYRAKVRYWIPIISRDEIAKGEPPTVKFWGVSKTVHDDLIKFCLNPDYEDIAHAMTGNDLIVTSIAKSKEFIYGKTEVMPRAKKTKLLDDMVLGKKLYDEQLNLFSLPGFNKVTKEEMISRLDGILNSALKDDAETIANDENAVAKSTNSEKSDLQAKIDKLTSEG